MSGAAGIAAAKNRRSKPDPNQKPIISCNSKTGSCPLPPGSKTSPTSAGSKSTNVVDNDSLQITGPMPLMQVLAVHEQRLNKIDEKLKSACTPQQEKAIVCQTQQEGQAVCDAECYDRISDLEEKIKMLEEVIMNLQLTLTNVQSFAMETSLAMMKLQKQVPVASAPTASPPPEPSST
jgi:hypothetical protein